MASYRLVTERTDITVDSAELALEVHTKMTADGHTPELFEIREIEISIEELQTR